MTISTNVTVRIAQLPNLPMQDLWSLWDELFDQRPGHHNRTYLESRIAYKLQERAFGGLTISARRRLEKIGKTGEVPNHKRRSQTQIAPGATLIREYNGLSYRVTVLDDGRFEFQGQPYKSLSAIARAITGSAWSGPVFFGLKPSSRDRKGEEQ